MFEKIIENEINKKVKIIKRFSGGMSNYTFLIEVDNELFTYRIPGESSEVFIDRKIECENTKMIERLNLNCDNVYFNNENGHKMSKYIEGDDLSSKVFDYNEVASQLKLLHRSNLEAVNDYDLLGRLKKYEKYANNTDEEYFELKNELLILLEDYKDVKKVFCHNDAQKSNWIKSDKLYLLDWEFSGNNDPYYDIASFGNKDFNDAIILLKAYIDKEPNKEEIKRLMVNRMFQCLQWHNVALYKHQIGLSDKLNLDFKTISLNYINLSKNFLCEINKI